MHECVNASKIATLESKIENLSKYQDKQDNTAFRLEVKVDKIGDKIDKLQYWIMGLLGSFAVGLLIWLFKEVKT